MSHDYSDAQGRCLALFGISFDPRISRATAAQLLHERNLPGTGIPDGYTWREARAVSDDALKIILRNARAVTR